FLSNDAVVFGGYDCNPILFVNSGSEAEPRFQVHSVLDKMVATPTTKKAASNFSNVKNLFDASTRMGLTFGGESSDAAGALKTRHQNAINGLVQFWADASRSFALEFCTCGVDGRILTWDVSKMPDINLPSIGLA
ncbi:hypothetical protein BVRB_037910, partial [Beta vulgaris subsp. vulgaris]